MGALWQLADEKNWQQYGDMTPQEAADQFQDVIWEAYANDEGICPVLEAPFWDTYDNADDQEPEGAPEDWYGELVPVASFLPGDELTWRENVGIWAIAGFIAYSGQIGAAIAFIPFARRFVLKFRSNPLGAIAQIFIDGEILATVDTASAEDRIKAIDVQLDDDDEHQMWVAVSEDSPPGSTLQVVRKELNPSEVYPDNLRYNSDCDCIQQTYDDGVTWVDQPGQDPRTAPQFQYPPITADDPRCQAAANMSAYFEHIIDTVLGAISASLDVLGVATAIMPIFIELGPFAILFDLGLGLASGLVGLGVDVINTEFTPEVYQAFVCTFYCAIEPDGSVTPDDLVAIQNDLTANYNPDVYLIMGLAFLLMGNVGLSNAGTLGEAPADCDECSCLRCHVFNATEGWDGVYSAGGYATLVSGIWQSGAAGGAQICAIAVDLTDVDIRHVVVRGTAEGTANGGTRGLFRIVPFNQFYSGSGEAGDITFNWLGSETGTFTLQANLDSISNGTTTIYQLELYGEWPDELFGADNC